VLPHFSKTSWEKTRTMIKRANLGVMRGGKTEKICRHEKNFRRSGRTKGFVSCPMESSLPALKKKKRVEVVENKSGPRSASKERWAGPRQENTSFLGSSTRISWEKSNTKSRTRNRNQKGKSPWGPDTVWEEDSKKSRGVECR